MQFVHLQGLIPYDTALALQLAKVEEVLNGGEDTVLLCEHPPIITVGTSGGLAEGTLNGVPVVSTGRGGKATFHNPGQRVIYPILNLKRREMMDIKLYMSTLQQWVVVALKEVGVKGQTTDEIGVWCQTEAGLAKVAAIGVRVRKWVTFHGIAINVANDLTIASSFNPCGLGKPVARLKDVATGCSVADLDAALQRTCPF